MPKIIYVFFLQLIFSNFAFALYAESLRSKFLIDPVTDELSFEQLSDLLELAHESGQQELILEVKDKYGVEEDKGLHNLIKGCDMLSHTNAGYYRRGTKQEYTTSKHRPDLILTEIWDENTYQKIEKAFKYQMREETLSFNLVLVEWPIICMKRKSILFDSFGTFIHELSHFLHDDELKDIHPLNFLNSDDYVLKHLMSPEGEYFAFYNEAIALSGIKHLERKTPKFWMEKHLDNELNIIDEQKFQNYILNVLGYRSKFKDFFDKLIVHSYENDLKQLDRYKQYLELFEQNLEIAYKNLDVYKHNQKIYQKNIELIENNIEIIQKSIEHRGRYDEEDLAEQERELKLEKDKLAKSKVKIPEQLKEIEFCQQMIDLSQLTIDEQKEQLQVLKSKFSQLTE